MLYKINNTFTKDINEINNKKLLIKLEIFLVQLEQANNIFDLIKCKKISGYKNFYRIRISDYRVGIEFIDNIIILRRFKHRKDIYKVFP